MEFVLKVNINETKTMVAESSFEFAKRIFVKGEEISPIPWAYLVNLKSVEFSMATFIMDACERKSIDISSYKFIARFLKP